MSKQSEKYHISLAGEYYVAAELQRLGVHSSITYGNAKKTDVIAFSESGEKAVAIEVKSTNRASWVIGNSIPSNSNKPWVLVNIPTEYFKSPAYYILTQSQINQSLTDKHKKYNLKYKNKHGHNFESKGVYSIMLSEVEKHINNWEVILKFIRDN